MPKALSHSSPAPISFGKESWAYYSVTPTRRALIFLHGFKGESIGTWSQFNRLIYEDKAFEGFDCFFVGYDGLYESLVASSKRFYGFLLDVLRSDGDARERLSVLDDRELPYLSVVVVAHSMGSVVVRRALLEADDKLQEWRSHVSMILYAPAHLGARVVRYISTFLDKTFLRSVTPLLKYKCHPIDELTSGSELLTSLFKEVTSRLEASPEKTFLVAKRVIHAFGDDVVEHRDQRFCRDPEAEWIEGTHESIVKPSSLQSQSVRQLIDALKETHG